MDKLISLLCERAKDIVPRGDEISVNGRQAEHLSIACHALSGIAEQTDYLIIAEQFRIARLALDALTGKASTEDMLDALFGKFCIGK